MAHEYTAEMATAAAAKGAAWMDEHCEGWTLLIDLNALALESPAHCVLGQTAHCVTQGAVDSGQEYDVRYLDGDYDNDYWSSYEGALKYIGMEYDEAADDDESCWTIEHGFDIQSPEDPPRNELTYTEERKARYEMLTIAWKEQIRKRGELVEAV